MFLIYITLIAGKRGPCHSFLINFELFLTLFHLMAIASSSSSSVPEYKALLGGPVTLPCNTSVPTPDDAVSLIFWYKGDSTGAPIYSVDARSSPVERAKHFPSESLAGRVAFNVSVQPTAFLTIDTVKQEDAGEYRCRVDFRWARTANTIVYLDVVVPPSKVIIKDEKDHPVHELVGPFNEGSDVKLVCVAYGGKPSPIVHWFRDNALIDDTYTTTISEDGMISLNDLLISKLARSDLNSVYTCRAINNNLTLPITRSVTLDINLNPLYVKIISIKRPLSAERKMEMVCQSKGSRPPAQISWFLNRKQLIHTRETFSADSNMTTSVLNLVPSSQDNGAYLVCKAENLRLANSSQEENWKLNIYYRPRLRLNLRSNIKMGIVKERSEILLECQIDANPMVTFVGWYINGDKLDSDPKKGIIVDNTTLVIKFAQRENTGNYSCSSTNIEGKTESNQLAINVHYAPTCKQDQQRVYGAAIGETTTVVCEVEAEPEDVTFGWRFNKTELDPSRYHYSNERLRSSLYFTPSSLLDYGTLACNAKNIIGAQQEPCLLTLIPAGRPDPVHDCSAANQTWNSILVDCKPGFDGYGGLAKQTFHLSVYDAKRQRLLFNVTRNTRPSFSVSGLQSGASYLLDIYSANPKGRSNNVTITASTVTMLRRSSEHIPSIKFDPLLAIVIGLAATLLLVAIIIVLILTIRSRDNERHVNRDKRKQESSSSSRVTPSDAKEPDVVPSLRRDSPGKALCSGYQSVSCSTYNIPVSETPIYPPNGGFTAGTEYDIQQQALLTTMRSMHKASYGCSTTGISVDTGNEFDDEYGFTTIQSNNKLNENLGPFFVHQDSQIPLVSELGSSNILVSNNDTLTRSSNQLSNQPEIRSIHREFVAFSTPV